MNDTTAMPDSRALGTPFAIELTSLRPGEAENLVPPLCFGARDSDSLAHPGLGTADGRPRFECWRGPRCLDAGHDGGVHWRASGDFLFGWLEVPAAGDCLAVTRDAYRGILHCLQHREHPHLLRVWNFVPGINEGAGDDERYKRFCYGRALALEEAGSLPADDALPAATAVGAGDSDRLLIYFLASREPGERVENARQVSAFNYPRQYGPRSPRFSRAMAWRGASAGLLFISGTASIVGHETRHAGDLAAQLDETWRNLEHVRERGAGERPLLVRAYVRRAADLEPVDAFLRRRLPEGAPLSCVQADICRPDLLLEVEGVFRLAGAAAG